MIKQTDKYVEDNKLTNNSNEHYYKQIHKQTDTQTDGQKKKKTKNCTCCTRSSLGVIEDSDVEFDPPAPLLSSPFLSNFFSFSCKSPKREIQIRLLEIRKDNVECKKQENALSVHFKRFTSCGL